MVKKKKKMLLRVAGGNERRKSVRMWEAASHKLCRFARAFLTPSPLGTLGECCVCVVLDGMQMRTLRGRGGSWALKG